MPIKKEPRRLKSLRCRQKCKNTKQGKDAMNEAKRIADGRQNRAGVTVICGVVAIAGIIWLLPNSQFWLAAKVVVCSILFCVTAALFLRTLLSAQTRCPECNKLSCEFTDRNSEEFLVCSSCEFEQPTGYDFSS